MERMVGCLSMLLYVSIALFSREMCVWMLSRYLILCFRNTPFQYTRQFIYDQQYQSPTRLEDDG